MSKIILEKRIRGEVAYWSVFLETIMVRIIMLSQPKTRKDKYVNIKDFDFSTKIDKSFSYLKKFYGPIYKKDFRGLKEEVHDLRLFRNRMIHCPFNWDESDLSKMTILEIVRDADGMDYYKPIKYRISTVDAQIEKFKKFVRKFIAASFLIDANLKQEFPELYKAIL